MKQYFPNLIEADKNSPNYGKPVYVEVPFRTWYRSKVVRFKRKCRKILQHLETYCN